MPFTLNIPWKRYALISELTRRLETKSPQLGKTVLQKMVYLLQELFDIDCDYEFDFYTYGPFTSQLLHDLELVEHFGAVIVRTASSMSGGYEIHLGDKADIVRAKGADFLNDDKVNTALSNLIDEFGNFSAKDLELRSTIVYVDRDLSRENESPSVEKIVKIVKELKPRFTDNEIRAAVDELKSKLLCN